MFQIPVQDASRPRARLLRLEGLTRRSELTNSILAPCGAMRVAWALGSGVHEPHSSQVAA
jgi:hypothetical protein